MSGWPEEDQDFSKRMFENLPRGRYDNYAFPIVFRQNREETGKRLRDFLDTR